MPNKPEQAGNRVDRPGKGKPSQGDRERMPNKPNEERRAPSSRPQRRPQEEQDEEER